MSKFDQFVDILKEYDVRFSGQQPPSGPGDGYSVSSDPNIAGNRVQGEPGNDKPLFNIKPFADEANHHDSGKVLPYPLDHNVFERLANLQIAIKEIQSLINIALKTNTLTSPQKHILQQYLDNGEQQIKNIQQFIQDLELLSSSL